MRLPARVRESEPALLPCALLAAALCAAMFALQGRLGFNLQDEALLWYGVIRTHAGELPLRDFRAYDPGRYLWSAAWSTLLGDGLVAVRAAAWIFAAFGLCAGLLCVSRTVARRWLLVPAGALLVVWMSPPWKLYECSFALLAAWAAVRLIERPSGGRRVAAGVVVGLAAFFGRNLGVYAGLGVLLAALLAVWKVRAPLVRSFADLALGTLLGYAPMLLLVACADGFRAAFVDSILFYARQSELNAELPFPWPWRVDLAGRGFGAAAAALSIGALFLLVPAGYLLGVLRAVLAGAEELPRLAPLAGACLVGLPWFHHAAVRSDLPHLAQSIHPFLLAALALPAALTGARGPLVRAAVWSALALLTCGAIVTSLPVVRRLDAPPGAEHVAVRVGADELVLAPNDARSLQGLIAVVQRNVPPDEPLWVSAQILGLYPALGRRAPTWDIYPAWQADDAEQERMLRELSGVRWALIDTRPIGRDPRMRLELSHPRVWTWLQASFERVALPGAPDTLLLLRRRG
jgi:hypothetical protein